MRWIFLVFILGLAGLGNLAVFEQNSVVRLVGGFAFNTFIAGLLTAWWFAYFSAGAIRSRGLRAAHALLTLSGGLGAVCLGLVLLLSESCESTANSTGFRAGNQFWHYVLSLGYCRELGFAAAGLGLWLAYPAIRLFLSLSGRSV